MNIHTSSKYLTCPESTFYHAGRREERESIEVHLAILPSISNFHDIFAKVRLFFKKRSTTASETILSDGSKFFFLVHCRETYSRSLDSTMVDLRG